jgi:hypothetical protein
MVALGVALNAVVAASAYPGAQTAPLAPRWGFFRGELVGKTLALKSFPPAEAPLVSLL